MKKVLGIGILGLVLLYPVAAWLTGFAIESRLGLPAGQLNAQMPYLSVVDQKYHRGWYTSEQDLTLAFTPGAALGVAAPNPGMSAIAAGFRFTLHNVIHHGPFCGLTCFAAARVDSHIVWSDAMKASLAKVFGSAEPVTIQSKLGFLGGGTATLTSPPIKDLTLDDGGHVTWDGLKLNVAYTKNNDSIDLQGTAPQLLVTGGDGSRVQIATVTVSVKNKRVLPLIYAGDVNFAIDKVAFAGPGGGRSFSIDNVHYNVKAAADDGTMSIGVLFGSGAVDSAAAALKAVHFDFTLKNLDLQSLETMTEKMQAYNQSNAGATASPDPKAVLAVVKGPALELLLHNPEIRFDNLGFETPHGQASFKGVVRMTGVKPEDLAENADPKALLAKLDADLDLSIDDVAIAEVPALAAGTQQLQTLAQQHFITHDNGLWHSKIRFAAGQLTMNDLPFSPGALRGPPGAPPGGVVQPMPQPNVVPVPRAMPAPAPRSGMMPGQSP